MTRMYWHALHGGDLRFLIQEANVYCHYQNGKYREYSNDATLFIESHRVYM